MYKGNYIKAENWIVQQENNFTIYTSKLDSNTIREYDEEELFTRKTIHVFKTWTLNGAYSSYGTTSFDTLSEAKDHLASLYASVQKRQSIKEKVADELKKKQAKKDFQDTDYNISHTKKYKRNFKEVSIQNLSEIEEDSALAFKLVVKDQLFPKIDIEAYKEKGKTSDYVYFVSELRKAIASKPFDSADARKAYTKGITAILEAVDKFEEVSDLQSFLSDFYYHDENIGVLGQSWETTRKFKGIYGTRFYNFCRKTGGAYKGLADYLFIYKSVSKEEASEYKTAILSNFQKKIDRYKEALKGENSPEYKRAYKNQINKTSQFIRDIDSNIPERFKEHKESWAWSETKKTVSKTTKTSVKINTKPALSHIERKGGLTVSDISVEAIEKWGFSQVLYGNGLNKDWSKAHSLYFLSAMLDLAEILNIDIAEINKKGGLQMHFATSGGPGHLATYYPAYKKINLSHKGGDGSVAHEWGHYLDNFLGEQAKTRNNPFLATEVGAENSEIDIVIKKLIDLFNNSHPRKVKVLFAAQSKARYKDTGNTLEESIRLAQNEYRVYRSYENKNLKSVHQFFGFLAKKYEKDYIEVEMETYRSDFLIVSEKMGNSKYWTSKAEMFARAFESFVLRKLQAANRSNNYLVSGFKTGNPKHPYPIGKEADNIDLEFEKLISLIKEEYNISEFKTLTDERKDIYIDLDSKKEKQDIEKQTETTKNKAETPKTKIDQKVKELYHLTINNK